MRTKFEDKIKKGAKIAARTIIAEQCGKDEFFDELCETAEDIIYNQMVLALLD